MDVTTKQNILCNGQSIRQVIQASLDRFSPDIHHHHNNNTNDRHFLKTITFRPPSFKFVLPKSRLFVLVLDRSVGPEQEDGDKWEVLQQAMLPFIAKLPMGNQLSIITFTDDDAHLNLPPTTINEDNWKGLHGRIPRRPLHSRLASEATRQTRPSCLDCAMNLVFKVLNLTQKQEVVPDLEPRIILTTNSLALPSKKVESKVEAHQLPIYRLHFASASSSHDSKMKDSMANLTAYGNSFVVSDSKLRRPALLSQLSQTLTEVVGQAANIQVTPFYRDRRVPDPDNVISGNFVVEESLRKNLKIVLTVEDERDVESFEVLSPTGVKHSFPSFEQGLVFFDLEGLNEPGIWTYSVRLYQALTKPYMVHLETLAEPNHDESISLKAWIVKSNVNNRTNIMLYAALEQASLPVLNAEVVAEIRRPGMGHENVQVQLRDLGTGYPDITKGDGIYSAYFTDFVPETGFYQVMVSANHNHGRAQTPKLSAGFDMDKAECCGSAMPVSYSIPTGPFQRFSVGPSFFVEQAASFYLRQSSDSASRLVNDVYPPSRITDFAVENYLTDSLFVTLSWTAPGGDFDQGKASRYEIRCYTNKEALRDDNFAEMSIPVHRSLIPEPEEYGKEQRCTVGIPWPNEVFYYAIVAFDEADNRGVISNTISVFIKEEPSTVAPLHDLLPSDNEINDSQPLLAGTQTHVTFIAIGVVSAVVVLLIIFMAILIRRHFTTLKSIVSTDSEKGDDDSAFSDTLKKFAAQTASNATSKTLTLTSDKQGIWSPGGSSPTSDYSSQKSPLPSISGTMQSWSTTRQKAVSQELPGVHKVVSEKQYLAKLDEKETHTNPSTDCSIYESSDAGSNGAQVEPESPNSCKLPARISVLEDFSVYRDLSNISQADYFSFSNHHLPSELLQSRHVITVPPSYDLSSLDAAKKRHESLV